MDRTNREVLMFDIRRIGSVDLQRLVAACYRVSDRWSRPQGHRPGGRLLGTWALAWLRDQVSAELQRRILPDAELREPGLLEVPEFDRHEAAAALLTTEELAGEPLPEIVGALVDLVASHFRLQVALLAVR
jgi:SAM-dependent methyltransferase